VLLFRRATRWIDPPGERAALNTNALDEVPDSTWFTNRLGAGGLTAAQVAAAGAGATAAHPLPS